MPERIYLDANIYLDYFLDRKDSLKPLGEFAFKLLNEAVNCKFFVIISNETLREVCKVLRKTEEGVWATFFSDLVEFDKISIIFSSSENEQKAKEFSRKFRLHFADSLHLVLAVESKAILVSRDKHFEGLKDSFAVKTPEELLASM
jgi:predicted nucleic acid-binding protein